VGSDKFQLKAWSKVSQIVSKVTLSSNVAIMEPNAPFILSGTIYNYSGVGIPGKEVILMDNSLAHLGSVLSDREGGYSFIAKIRKLGEHTIVATSSNIHSNEIRFNILPKYEMIPPRKARARRDPRP
jgi:hypothetical protein